MSRSAIIDNEKISKWRSYVESHVITYDDYMKIFRGEAKLVGDRLEHCLFMDYGFKFVYSIEEAPSPDFKKLHTIKRLSGSVDNGNYPTLQLIKIMLDKLGMKTFDKCQYRINKNDIVPNIEIIDLQHSRDLEIVNQETKN
ncbi:hypothetical protein [Niemeyer virus]|nr:hypothetical protein [Niemeyer virus]